MRHRLWLAAGTAAIALHIAVWFALHRGSTPAAPRTLQFTVAQVQFAEPTAAAVGTPTAPKHKPHHKQPKPHHKRHKPRPNQPKPHHTRPKPHHRQPKPPPERPKRQHIVRAREAAKPHSTPRQSAKPISATAPAPYVGPDYGAAYLHNPPPVYPLMARLRGISGRVVIEAKVTVDGRCAGARVLHSSGHHILDNTALAAVKKWHFVPANRNGNPVTATVTIPVTFKLQGEG